MCGSGSAARDNSSAAFAGAHLRARASAFLRVGREPASVFLRVLHRAACTCTVGVSSSPLTVLNTAFQFIFVGRHSWSCASSGVVQESSDMVAAIYMVLTTIVAASPTAASITIQDKMFLERLIYLVVSPR